MYCLMINSRRTKCYIKVIVKIGFMGWGEGYGLRPRGGEGKGGMREWMGWGEEWVDEKYEVRRKMGWGERLVEEKDGLKGRMGWW